MRNGLWFSVGVMAGVCAAAALGVVFTTGRPAGTTAALGLPSAMAAEAAGQAPATYRDPVAVAQEKTGDGKLRILVFGAHPDDAEIRAGGTAAMWSDQGHHVQFVSATNSDIGHWRMAGGALAIRRNAEAQEAAKILGVTSLVLDIHDGELEPSGLSSSTLPIRVFEYVAGFVNVIRGWALVNTGWTDH